MFTKYLMKKIEEEFSKNSNSYNQYNQIQTEVAKTLIENCQYQPKRILDLGSGTGEVYKQIDWKIEKFLATDISAQMCDLHPIGENVEIRRVSFDDVEIFTLVEKYSLDMILSSSALHWSSDIESLLKGVEQTKLPFAFSLFTSGTFSSFLNSLGVNSYLKSSQLLISLFQEKFEGNSFIKHYSLEFETPRSLLQYIKKSGVSINNRSVPISKLKHWIDSDPSLILEFEVVYFYSDNR
jgi:malonyl-CoA O-methyltransferase